jgi:hypothetical protein
VPGISDTVVNNVRAWIILPFGVDRDERAVIVL